MKSKNLSNINDDEMIKNPNLVQRKKSFDKEIEKQKVHNLYLSPSKRSKKIFYNLYRAS